MSDIVDLERALTRATTAYKEVCVERDRLRERVDWFEGELAKADEWKAHNRALQEEIEQIKRRMEAFANEALAKEAGQ